MILRNPSLRRDSLFVACLFCFFSLSNPLSSQGVIGDIKEDGSSQPVESATISIAKGDSIMATIEADPSGHFQYITTEAGRLHITISALGYASQTTDEIFLDGYSTFRMETFLDAIAFPLESVSVTAPRPASPHFQKISALDLAVTAANYDDPVRVATSYPGIVQLNDQANHISVRGQNPLFNSWYLEGLEIVNPNHTNNAGTFSDLSTPSGGGINMFSAQALGSTNIYTGLNPLSIGRSSGAVIDMHLHESAKPEFRAKAGFLGFELGGGKNIGAKGILDVNLRYSFTGLLANMGVDFGGEKIGFYDGVISFRHETPGQKFKIFAWGGSSKNEFNHVEDSADIMRYKDFFDIDYNNDILGAGVRYEANISRKATLQIGSAYSILETSYQRHGQFGPAPVALDRDEKTELLSTTAEILIQHSARINSFAGIDYTYRQAPFNQEFMAIQDESFLRPHIGASIEMSSSLTLDIGGEANFSFVQAVQPSTLKPGYRAVLNWKTGSNSLFHIGARHTAGQRVRAIGNEAYSYQLIIEKYELGWSFSGIKQVVQLKSYFQEIKNLTIYRLENGFAHLADYLEPAGEFIITGPLFFAGKSRNYGLEGEWKYFNNRGFRFSFNQSVFRSFRELNNEWFDEGKFDNKFATHLTLSKEFIKQKKGKNRLWSFSLRGLLQGGFREPEIDIAASQENESTVFVDPFIFANQLAVYKRIDIGIYRIIANTKVRWRYALDIQNVGGFTNIAYHYYDPFLESIESQEQLGIIPVLSIQASW